MKGIFILIVFFSFDSVAQNDSLDFRVPTKGITPGFYATFEDVLNNKPLHWGQFKIEQSSVECGWNEICIISRLLLTSKIKQEIYPLDFKYVYDGVDLYMGFKTAPFLVGTHIGVELLLNKGRFCYFEQLEAPNYNYAPAHWKKSPRIVDLQTNTVIKPSRENLTKLFKDNMELYEAYKNDDEKKKLLKYIILLNQKLGYEGRTEK